MFRHGLVARPAAADGGIRRVNKRVTKLRPTHSRGERMAKCEWHS